MMDELDLLKKDWQQRGQHHPKLSFDDIHRMIWKKSSSLVRWIFYISILEFAVPHLLYLVPSFRDSNGYDVARDLGIHTELLIVTGVQYAVVLYFIVQFYKRYREISVLDDATVLMNRIIRTRRTVKHYVIFCLSMVLVIFGLFILGMYFSDNLAGILNIDPGKVTNPVRFKWTVMGVMGILAVVFTTLMGGIYFLLYGLLTRRLYANYKELKRMDG